jgi:chromatin structure-remodeling complex subunit SFH1
MLKYKCISDSPPELLDMQARRPTSLIPIRVEFETETHRIRDCFVWNLHEEIINPETFARTFCTDLDLPILPWAETVANQIRAQIEDHEGVASMGFDVDALNIYGPGEDEVPECRVILSVRSDIMRSQPTATHDISVQIDVQIATYHLMDHIEWDLLSPLTPETFSTTLCADLGLSGEAVPLVAHAIHEELIKHKRDAIEWGVLGGETEDAPDKPRDRSGFGLLKDKTGLGLGWGRAPKDGRGPKPLRSVWRDWAEAEEFRTRFEVLSAEEVERREIERERATRYVSNCDHCVLPEFNRFV